MSDDKSPKQKNAALELAIASVEDGEGDTLPVTVNLVEPTGAESHLYGRFKDNAIVAAIAGRCPLQPGETAHLRLDPKHLHVFETAGGQRI